MSEGGGYESGGMVVPFNVVPFHSLVGTSTHDVAAPIWSPAEGAGGLRVVLARGQFQKPYFGHHLSTPDNSVPKFVVSCKDTCRVPASEEVVETLRSDVRDGICPDAPVNSGGWGCVVLVRQAPNSRIGVFDSLAMLVIVPVLVKPWLVVDVVQGDVGVRVKVFLVPGLCCQFVCLIIASDP